jgi:hypothetical protein
LYRRRAGKVARSLDPTGKAITTKEWQPGEGFGSLFFVASTPQRGPAAHDQAQRLPQAEAARALGVSQNTLRSWGESGKIPMHRNPANGYRLFWLADLGRFLAKVARSAKG